VEPLASWAPANIGMTVGQFADRWDPKGWTHPQGPLKQSVQHPFGGSGRKGFEAGLPTIGGVSARSSQLSPRC